jgi:hypothetical protein
MAVFSFMLSCGGGRSPATAESYFRDLVAANNVILGPAQTEESRLNDAVQTGADGEVISAYQQFFAEAIPLTRSYYESLQKLNPPADIRAAHEEYTNSVGDLIGLYESISGRLQNAVTRAEFDAAMPQDRLQEAILRGNRACHQLQDLADQRGIAVDLLCGSQAQPAVAAGRLWNVRRRSFGGVTRA